MVTMHSCGVGSSLIRLVPPGAMWPDHQMFESPCPGASVGIGFAYLRTVYSVTYRLPSSGTTSTGSNRTWTLRATDRPALRMTMSIDVSLSAARDSSASTYGRDLSLLSAGRPLPSPPWGGLPPRPAGAARPPPFLTYH